MNLLVTVCARAGSKGVKGKNIRDFLGYPIAFYTLAAYDLFLRRFGGRCESCRLAVNTDSKELADQLEKTAVAHTVIPRKPTLAGDRVSKIDVVRDTLCEMESQAFVTFDTVLDLDVTSPLRKAADIQNVLDALLQSPGADIALSVTTPRRNPYFNQLVKNEEGYLVTAIRSDFVARQQAPAVFDANASVYAYRPGYLKNSGGIFLGARLVGSMMEDTGILDIDGEQDFNLMEAVARYLYGKDPAFGEVREHIKRLLIPTG